MKPYIFHSWTFRSSLKILSDETESDYIEITESKDAKAGG